MLTVNHFNSFKFCRKLIFVFANISKHTGWLVVLGLTVQSISGHLPEKRKKREKIGKRTRIPRRAVSHLPPGGGAQVQHQLQQ